VLRFAPLVVWLLVASAPAAGAVEVETELALGPEFAWFGAEARGALLQDRLVLGGGLTAISDYKSIRAGGRAHAGVDLERGAIALTAGWAPPQGGRGWLEIEPELSLRGDVGAVELELAARGAWRRVDVLSIVDEDTGGSITPVDQLQMQVEGSLEWKHRLRLRLLGDGAFYNRDLSPAALHASDFGPLVTIAARPERFAGRGLVEVRCAEAFWLALGFGGLAFAGTPGGALLPRVGIALGPVGGATVRASVEPIVPIASDVGVRMTFRVELAWER
jgi:hypothetical protein